MEATPPLKHNIFYVLWALAEEHLDKWAKNAEKHIFNEDCIAPASLDLLFAPVPATPHIIENLRVPICNHLFGDFVAAIHALETSLKVGLEDLQTPQMDLTRLRHRLAELYLLYFSHSNGKTARSLLEGCIRGLEEIVPFLSSHIFQFANFPPRRYQ